ncbi:uncharacterized protein BX664DRAFT_342401 [Halteromyces radiatus]|uniref:uncharacterized protein n=1 Tax=Halteromyces radiatus TaxID=101107 RepID=UPI00221F3BD5|nr:uncharacterized protein BX664DRAFT_342401 [Halteromyces radiatus]KAI8078650.1 hypothetical protein BX664DRAFT_342401 [Halteromyces radiatus]
MTLVKDLTLTQQKTLQSLVADINSLYSYYSKEYMEQWSKGCDNDQVLANAPDVVKQVEQGLRSLGLFHISRFIPVESDYYDWEIQQRAFRVKAPSRSHMCKSLIMENTRCTHTEISDPLYSRFYCIITRYDSPVNTQVLMNYVRGLTNKTISKKNYNFRLADAKVSLELTGFQKGGVCPIGMKSAIPLIMSECVTRLNPPVMYLGAGHIDWKLGIPVQEFIDKTGCFITNLD